MGGKGKDSEATNDPGELEFSSILGRSNTSLYSYRRVLSVLTFSGENFSFIKMFVVLREVKV